MRLTVGTKLTGGFLGVALMMTALGIFSIIQLGRVNDASTEIAENWLPSTQFLGGVDGRTADFRLAQLAHNLTTSDAEMAPIERDMAETRAAIADLFSRYEPLVSAGEERTRFESLRKRWATYLDDHDKKFLPLSRSNSHEEAAAYLKGDGAKLYESVNEDVAALVEINVKGGKAASDRGDELFAQSQKLVIGSIVAALLAAMGLGVYLSRGISRGVRAATTAAQGLAKGDVDQSIDVQSRDEIGG